MGDKPYILWFDEVGLGDLPLVGGKNVLWERCAEN